MRLVVTGAAGFMGSHLVDHLLDAGHEVVGIDAFTPSASRQAKEANLAGAMRHPRFGLIDADLCVAGLAEAFGGAEVVVHMAGQAGVRESWGDRFAAYAGNNLLATQRVLEAAVAAGVRRVAYASSSAVYGSPPCGPCGEETPPRPVSPFGVSVLAGEGLLVAYAQHGLSTTAIRYSSVYGPRQRPGMAIERFIASALTGEPVPLFGSGGQCRDLIFVGDAVSATAAIVASEMDGPVNVGSGEAFTINEVLEVIADVVGTPPVVERRPAVAGDPPRERLAIDRLRDATGVVPRTDLRGGIAAQVEAARGAVMAGVSPG